MSKIYYNIIRLKKFFSLSGESKTVAKSDLLSSNESLKNFGKAWNVNSGGDVLMMIELAQRTYMENNSYNEDEMNAVKYALSQIAIFMRDCGREWKDYEESQQKS